MKFDFKLYFPFLLIVLIIGGISYYQLSINKMEEKISTSNKTMVLTDSMRLTMKVSMMLYRAENKLDKAIIQKDEDKLYESLDFFDASIGFIKSGYIENLNLVNSILPKIERNISTIEKNKLDINTKQLKEIQDSLKMIHWEIEQLEKNIWIRFQKNFLSFQANEHKINTIYEILLIISIIITLFFTVIYYKQKNLHKAIIEKDKELESLAYFDLLTELPNRRNIENKIDQNIDLSQRYNKNFYTALIDIDNFKQVNDSLGHEAGDELIKHLSGSISDVLRTHDKLGRIGGDEFFIVFDTNTKKEELSIILKRIMNEIQKSKKINNIDISPSASIGLANFPNDANDKMELFKNTDIAMFQAKHTGRNKFEFYNKKLGEEIKVDYALENDIKRGFDANEFELYYQPKFDVLNNRVIGLEALLRWNHPSKGFLTPWAFIHIIEKGCYTKEFGEWIIIEASKMQKKINTLLKQDIDISVNLSVKHIMSANFYDEMLNLADKHSINLSKISFEITEYTFMENHDLLKENLIKLTKAGFRFSLDDFGTGYSSLTYLKHLPIDCIKIDKSFVDEIKKSDNDKLLLNAIINIAKVLDINIIIEGVEEQYQIDYLKTFECYIIQGYFISKPLQEEDLLDFLIVHKP